MAQVVYRELGRQAVLLAARSELGCNTRDESLGEDATDADIVFDATIETRHGVGVRIVMSHESETLYDGQADVNIGPIYDIKDIAEKLEPMVRGEIAEALKKAGVEGQPVAQVDSGPVAREIEERLATMSHIDQFRALRGLYSAIRENGESPELLCGVARAYANLSMLSLTTLDSRTKVYAARALLYAHRLKNRAPDAASTTWCLAYVYTICGFPSLGLDFLKDVEEGAEADAPAWLEVALDGAHHNFTELGKVAQHEEHLYRELAAVLRMRSACASGSNVLAIETGAEALAIAPHCLFLVEASHRVAGVSLGHRTSVIGPKLHGKLIAEEMTQVEGLPEVVAKRLDVANAAPDVLAISNIGRDLVKTAEDDRLEPSWGLLGGETLAWSTLHIYRRADFLRNYIGVDASDFVRACEPIIEGDHWAPMIRSYAVMPSPRASDYDECLEGFSVLDANLFSSYDWFWNVPEDVQIEGKSVGEYRFLVNSARGATEQEYAVQLMGNRDKSARIQTAKWMYDCSRHAPLRFAILIREDEKVTDEQVEEWAKEYGQHPIVALAVGQRLASKGKKEEAIDYYRLYLDSAPDPKAFRELAQIYFELGNPEWQLTLEDILHHRDYALDHSSAACTIASTLMQEGQYRAALPWATRGSESGAGWAWEVETWCRTNLGQYVEAEALAQQNTMRYNGPQWYEWCVLSGRGDVDQAWQVQRNVLQQKYDTDSRDYQFEVSLHSLLQGQEEACLDALVKRLATEDSDWDTMMAALLADKLGKTEMRDSYLAKEANKELGDTPHPYTLLAQLFQASLVSGEVNIADIEAIAEKQEYPANWLSSLRLMTAEFLATRGNTEQATELRQQCFRQPFHQGSWLHLLAAKRLHDDGIDPFQLEGIVFPSALVKPKEKPEQQSE